MDKCFIDFQELSLKAKNVFGPDCIVKNVIRLYGGAQKGTYKIQCANNFLFVLYIWDKKTNYFSRYRNKNDIFRSTGADLFLYNHKLLSSYNIPVPKLYYIDMTKETYDFDYAFVEYISGKEIEKYMDSSRSEVKHLFASLSEYIKKLHSIKRDFAGTVNAPQRKGFKCEEYIYSVIEDDMNYLIRNCSEVALKEEVIRNVYKSLYKNIKPRKEYELIHGELGPNHVYVDEKQKLYFIDIECVKYFDKEYENSFLEFRFGEFYKYLEEENLDRDRMKFYKLANHISCLTGALKLTKEDYYDMEDVYRMISYNLKQVSSCDSCYSLEK